MALQVKTAIDCISQGCKRLHTEVYRTKSLDQVIFRGDQFFNLMSKINKHF